MVGEGRAGMGAENKRVRGGAAVESVRVRETSG